MFIGGTNLNAAETAFMTNAVVEMRVPSKENDDTYQSYQFHLNILITRIKLITQK